MHEIDLKKCVQETEEMRQRSPISTDISWPLALTLISYVQLATRNPQIADNPFGREAIDFARKLQGNFDPESESYKSLERGWEFQADLRQTQNLRDRVLQIFESAENLDM
jgi:hypothetical protein